MNKHQVETAPGNRVFSTGSRRDSRDGKGRFDLISPHAIERYARHMEKGCHNYGERNWEKGQPQSVFFDSASRHLNKYAQGLTDEDHLAAAFWNIAALLHQEAVRKPDDPLMDFPVHKE